MKTALISIAIWNDFKLWVEIVEDNDIRFL